MSLRVSILGCGWLGFPLASRLVLKGLTVAGSVTNEEKFPQLLSHGIKPYLIRVNPAVSADSKDFFTAPVCIITLPFRRDLTDPQFYYTQINSIIKELETQEEKPWVIFTSSTMVYPNDQQVWDEDMAIIADSARAKVLRDIEELVLHHRGTVLRLGGLYGPAREIHRFFLKPALLKTAQGKMNLLHQQDAIGIIEAVLDKRARGEIFNAVSPEHPTRQQLYAHLSKKYGVAMPVFDEEALKAAGKIVSNEKIKRVLEYRFIHPNPMDD